MKRSIIYPDWAEKYRGKGRTLRKVRDGYGLYECTSVYVKGEKYPKSKQTYLGMITEKDGFIPKRSGSLSGQYLEFGLSHFIMANFKRDLERCTFGGSEDIVLLGIVFFIFGSIDDVFLQATYLTKGKISALKERIGKGISEQRLRTVSNKIKSLLEQKIPDDHDRSVLIKLLFLTVIDKSSVPESVVYPDAVKNVAERYGLDL
jgi:hypothetical protein